MEKDGIVDDDKKMDTLDKELDDNKETDDNPDDVTLKMEQMAERLTKKLAEMTVTIEKLTNNNNEMKTKLNSVFKQSPVDAENVIDKPKGPESEKTMTEDIEDYINSPNSMTSRYLASIGKGDNKNA